MVCDNRCGTSVATSFRTHLTHRHQRFTATTPLAVWNGLSVVVARTFVFINTTHRATEPTFGWVERLILISTTLLIGWSSLDRTRLLAPLLDRSAIHTTRWAT